MNDSQLWAQSMYRRDRRLLEQAEADRRARESLRTATTSARLGAAMQSLLAFLRIHSTTHPAPNPADTADTTQQPAAPPSVTLPVEIEALLALLESGAELPVEIPEDGCAHDLC